MKPKIAFVGLCGASHFMQTDHFHKKGETVHATGLFTEPGGKGYNQCVAAARLGADALFLGAIGRDEGGALCEKFLQSEGITPLMEYGKQKTACAFILTDREGENQVSVYRGAADELSVAHISKNADEIGTCDVLVLGLETPWTATKAAAEIAFSRGIPVFFNPAPARALDVEFLKKCHVITPNRTEAATLFGIAEDATPREIAKAVLAAGLSRAVVTLGGEGALLVDEGHATLFAPLSVAAVDTTGAGDTFNAGLAVALANGQPLSDAVDFAMRAAAFSVTKRGVMAALPFEGDVEKMEHCQKEQLF